MGQLIDELGPIMVNRNTGDAAKVQLMMAAIDDERVVPYYAQLAEKPHFSPRLDACQALARFNNDLAFETLKKLMKTTGADIRGSGINEKLDASSADGVRHAAMGAIIHSPHPQAKVLAWTFADDPYYGVRLTVLHRAYELKTAEARAIIEKMTTDAHEMVRDEAIRYRKLLP